MKKIFGKVLLGLVTGLVVTIWALVVTSFIVLILPVNVYLDFQALTGERILIFVLGFCLFVIAFMFVNEKKL